MEKKFIIGILFLLSISFVDAMSIYVDNEWNAGTRENIEVRTDAKNITMLMEIVDSKGNIILTKHEPDLIQEGVYSSNIFIGTNEINNDYIIKTWIDDGLNTFSKTKVVKINKITFMQKIINYFKGLFGISLF